MSERRERERETETERERRSEAERGRAEERDTPTAREGVSWGAHRGHATDPELLVLLFFVLVWGRDRRWLYERGGKMNREKLMKMAGSVRTGGKGATKDPACAGWGASGIVCSL